MSRVKRRNAELTANRESDKSPAKAVAQAQESFNPFKDLNQWWFGYGSPVSLGFFRIVICSFAFLSLGLTGLDFDAWYTEKGFAPVGLIVDHWLRLDASFEWGPGNVKHIPFLTTFPRISLLSNVTDSRVAAIFYIVVMLAALLTAFGLWTRISSIVLAIGLVSIHHRNPLILHSGDTLMRLCIIYLAFSPCGAACSMDRVIGLWKGKAPPVPKQVSMWPQRIIQYQVVLVYFTTVWWKWFGTMWKDGTATFYPENLKEFNRFPVPELVRHQPFLAFTSYGTMIVELSLGTLVFYKPLRKYVLMAGIAMHGYIEYRFNIPFFAAIIVATYICFYDGDEVSAWAQRMGERLRKWRLLVELPKGQRLRPGPHAALKAMDPLSLVSYDTGIGPDWSAVDIETRPKKPFFSSWIRSFGAWPLGLIPGFWRRLLRRASSPDNNDSEPVLTVQDSA